jgi:hypothetical protein
MFSYMHLHTQIQVLTGLSQKYSDLHITPGFWQCAATIIILQYPLPRNVYSTYTCNQCLQYYLHPYLSYHTYFCPLILLLTT